LAQVRQPLRALPFAAVALLIPDRKLGSDALILSFDPDRELGRVIFGNLHAWNSDTQIEVSRIGRSCQNGADSQENQVTH
jgi:hypothetical protein